jgi:signal transduction histidine kinase
MSIVQSGLPLALSMPFILAAWIAFLHRQRDAKWPEVTPDVTAELRQDDTDAVGGAAAAVELEAALQEAVFMVDAAARSRWVRIELAIGVPMAVPANPSALRTALRDTMLTAINAAPGGQVLVTAATLGSQLHIRVTDDGQGTDQQLRETSMRQTGALIALRGGSIVVEARPGRGTSVTLRLPMPASAEPGAGDLVQLPVLADQAA